MDECEYKYLAAMDRLEETNFTLVELLAEVMCLRNRLGENARDRHTGYDRSSLRRDSGVVTLTVTGPARPTHVIEFHGADGKELAEMFLRRCYDTSNMRIEDRT